MKNLFSYLPKKVLIAIVAILLTVGIGAVVSASFGPDRPTYTMQNPADHVTFNSITDNPALPNGDERQFVSGALPGASDYSDSVNGVKDGDEVTVLMYVHNNAAENLNLKAENTTVRVALPTDLKNAQILTGYIKADNATPTEVYDTLDINSGNDNKFELTYVTGSAQFKNNVFTNPVALSDDIVTTGALIGYDKIDGVVPGCNKFSGWVTLKVKVKMSHYQIEKLARIAGEGTDKWRETVNADTGDTIEWRININNVGSTELKSIIVSDVVPDNMNVVKGSVKLIDSNFPPSNPYVYPESAVAVVNGKTQINVDTGDYPAGSNAVVTFKTVLADEKKLECGDNKFTNIAYATPKDYGAVADEAYVVITNDCGQPVYRCDLLNVTTVSDRNIKAEVSTTAQNGAALTTITYDFGDGSEMLVTDKTSVTYTYAKDGTFTVKAVPSFKVGDQVFTSPSDNCVKQVSFGSTPPTEIPNTGSGSLIGLFAGTSIAGAIGYRLWAIRRLGR